MRLFCIFLLVFNIASIAKSQNSDSLDYYIQIFKNKNLPPEQRQTAGLKIRKFQALGYHNNLPNKKLDTTSLLAIAEIKETLLKSDSILEFLILSALDTSLENGIRLNSLKLLNTLNSLKADSFLIANIDKLNYLKYPDTSGDEIEAMFPCFSLLSSKSENNYSLIKPIFSNLNILKTEGELYRISHILIRISNPEIAIKILEEYSYENFDNSILAKNIDSLLKFLQK